MEDDKDAQQVDEKLYSRQVRYEESFFFGRPNASAIPKRRQIRACLSYCTDEVEVSSLHRLPTSY